MPCLSPLFAATIRGTVPSRCNVSASASAAIAGRAARSFTACLVVRPWERAATAECRQKCQLATARGKQLLLVKGAIVPRVIDSSRAAWQKAFCSL